MRTLNGQVVCENCNSTNLTTDATPVSKISTKLFPSQVDLLNAIALRGFFELAQSLRLLHDSIVYHSDIEIGEDEKFALFNLKTLWEKLEIISKDTR